MSRRSETSPPAGAEVTPTKSRLESARDWLKAWAPILTVATVIIAIIVLVFNIHSEFSRQSDHLSGQIHTESKEMRELIHTESKKVRELIGKNSNKLGILEERVSNVGEDVNRMERKLDKVLDSRKATFEP